MLAIERKQYIKQMIKEEKTLKVTALSEKFGVTEETIRRDLEKLEKEGVLKRTYGGAVSCSFDESISNLEEPAGIDNDVGERKHFNRMEEEDLAVQQKMARQLVKSFKAGDVIMLDASSTSVEIAKAMGQCKNITIISNGLKVLSALSENDRVHVISTGGILRSSSLSFVGPTAKENIEKYYADKVIVACKGVDLERGLMENNELEVEIKYAMMERAEKIVLAIAHDKIGQRAIYQMKPLSEINTLCTDRPLSKEWEQFCKKYNIKVRIAEDENNS